MTINQIHGILLMLPLIIGCIIVLTFKFMDRDFWWALLMTIGIVLACGSFAIGVKLLGLF